MNDTVKDFLVFLGVDKEKLIKLDEARIKNGNDINSLIADKPFYKPSRKFKSVSIVDVVGHNRDSNGNIVADLSNYFDKMGDKYYSRSVSMLEIDTEEVMDKLSSSFKNEPIKLVEYDKGKFGINGNGLHRFHVMKMHYLTELLKNPQMADALREKYSFDSLVQEIDYIQTYSVYILDCIYPGLLDCESHYDEKKWEMTGKLKLINKSSKDEYVLTDDDLVKFTGKSMVNYLKKADKSMVEDFRDRLTEGLQFDSFREFFDDNLKGYLKTEEAGHENSSDKNFG